MHSKVMSQVEESYRNNSCYIEFISKKKIKKRENVHWEKLVKNIWEQTCSILYFWILKIPQIKMTLGIRDNFFFLKQARRFAQG